MGFEFRCRFNRPVTCVIWLSLVGLRYTASMERSSAGGLEVDSRHPTGIMIDKASRIDYRESAHVPCNRLFGDGPFIHGTRKWAPYHGKTYRFCFFDESIERFR